VNASKKQDLTPQRDHTTPQRKISNVDLIN